MAQAPAVDTDELLSQLAASEIDRLLAEADGKPEPAPEASAPEAAVSPASPEPAPVEPAPEAAADVLPEGSERAALLHAAGFDAANSPSAEPADVSAASQPTGDEKSALLRAAGFDSTDSPAAPDIEHPADPAAEGTPEDIDRPIPIYLKPLVWINAPLNSSPSMVRPLLGKAGLLTLVNALAVIAYVLFFRKH
jgi:hypothetical protein